MKPQPQLTVEEVPTDSLVPYARNAKIHTEEQIGQIAKSIEEFGFADPVGIWDGPKGPEIVEGHGRVMAAKKLGMSKVPVVRLDYMDDGQRRAYALVHNKLTMNTGWDFPKLDEEVESLDASFDMEAFGFNLVPEFDAIADLDEEELGSSDDSGGEYFSVTFTFGAEDREAVEAYLKAVGKQAVVDEIVERSRAWE